MNDSVETIGQFLDRVMKQKDITPKELARICGITNSYIGRIMKGKAGNLSAGTIVALADGLGIDPHDVFTAASGRPPEDQDTVDPLLILDTIQKLLLNPKGLELLRGWLNLNTKNQKTLAGFLKYLSEGQSKKGRKPKQK